MVLLDSNIFILDRFFPRDALYSQNRDFLDKLGSVEAAVSVLTLLEICGAASYRLPARELDSWLFRFTSVYPVFVLDAYGLGGQEAEAWWSRFVEETAGQISKKMTLGDALLLREAENYQTDALVTWNTKDFRRRTRIPIYTPADFPRRY
jgi:predicted nucleic acid-binding protein